MRRSPSGPVAVILIGLVVLVAVAIVSVPPPAGDQDPSSQSAGKAGTLALYTWLDALGIQVHRLSGEFTTAGSDVVVSVQPREGFTDSESEAVASHLAHGGDLILGIDPLSAALAEPLLRRLGVTLKGEGPAGVAMPVQPLDAAGRVNRVPLGPNVAFAPGPAVVPLLYQGDRVVAVALGGGSGGRAYLFGTSLPFANDGLRHNDSANLVLTLLERSHARSGDILRVGFDEVHHGQRTQGEGGALAVLDGPVGLAACLAALVVVMFLVTSGRRIGRPVPATDAGRVPSASEYVEAMAQLFERSQRRGGVADRYAAEFKQRLGAVTGADPHLGDEAFIDALAGRDPGLVGRAAATLARARDLAAARPSEAALVALARDVDAQEAEWAL